MMTFTRLVKSHVLKTQLDLFGLVDSVLQHGRLLDDPRPVADDSLVDAGEGLAADVGGSAARASAAAPTHDARRGATLRVLLARLRHFSRRQCKLWSAGATKQVTNNRNLTNKTVKIKCVGSVTLPLRHRGCHDRALRCFCAAGDPRLRMLSLADLFVSGLLLANGATHARSCITSLAHGIISLRLLRRMCMRAVRTCWRRSSVVLRPRLRTTRSSRCRTHGLPASEPARQSADAFDTRTFCSPNTTARAV